MNGNNERRGKKVKHDQSKMKLAERILAGVFVGCIIARDIVPMLWFEKLIASFGTALGLFYLIGFWWMQKPEVKSFRTVSITILYGIAAFFGASAIMFITLYLSGVVEMFILYTISTVVVIALDLLTSFGKKRLMNPLLMTRLAALFVLSTFLLNIPQQVRIKITYRNDPEFLKFYHDHDPKGEKEFYLIKHAYYDGWILEETE